MEGWVKAWIDKEREAGRTCFEVKQVKGHYYVYHATTTYDREQHKARKVAEYLGKLDPKKGLIPPKKTKIERPHTIWRYGDAALVHQVFKDLMPVLEKAFPYDWKEVTALAMLRATDFLPMKRIASAWQTWFDVAGLEPELDPRRLSEALKAVGRDRRGQNDVFKSLAVPGQELIYDLSSFFSRSENVNLAEKGYNKDHSHLKQINLALLCSADDHLPTMIRALPGSVRDIKSIYYTMEEIGIHDKTLILDRGFFSEDVCDFLDEKNLGYVLGAKRYSKLYREPVQLDRFFMYQDRLIKCGSASIDKRWIYRFEDTEMRVEEEKNLHQRVLEGQMTMEELAEKLPKSGHVLILSSMNTEPEKVYNLYKRRDAVEKMFDSYKNVLNADRTFLRDDASIFGHVFIAFLSLYAYCRIENLIRKAGLLDRLCPADVLLEFSKVYKVDTGDRMMFSDIPKGVAELDRKLGTNIFPKIA
jgi:hypothetical protein